CRTRIIAKEEIAVRRRAAATRTFRLDEIGGFKLAPGAVADVEHFNSLLSLEDAVDHAINIRFLAVKQVPQLVLLPCYRAAIRLVFQTEDCLFNPQIPFQGLVGIHGVDLPVQASEIALSMGSGVNDVSHASLQTRRKTPSLAASFPLSHPPDPDGSLLLHQPWRQCQATFDRPRHLALQPRPSRLP